MKLNKRTCLKQELEHMDTGKLNQILLMEAEKPGAQIDEERVHAVLELLETRQTDSPDLPNPIPEEACEKYRRESLKAKRSSKKHWVLRCCVAAAVVCLLLTAIPRVSGENLLIDFFVRITEDVVAFFSPGQTNNQMAYEYRTDHPGLQQVYDTMLELGVTAPVVPSWVPEGYKLQEIKIEKLPSKTRVYARLAVEKTEITLVYEIYGIAATHEYLRGEMPVNKYEWCGITHEIYTNNEKYMVYWKQENIECSIAVDCQEDSLTEILKSIYMMEEL